MVTSDGEVAASGPKYSILNLFVLLAVTQKKHDIPIIPKDADPLIKISARSIRHLFLLLNRTYRHVSFVL